MIFGRVKLCGGKAQGGGFAGTDLTGNQADIRIKVEAFANPSRAKRKKGNFFFRGGSFFLLPRPLMSDPFILNPFELTPQQPLIPVSQQSDNLHNDPLHSL